MILLIAFAFLAGIVTILSPCILPVLPIVLSSSLTGGKRRPLGIVTGFILSFTFFTLFLASIVKATGISADALRTVAVVVIGMFGISLLVPKFQVLLESLFSRLATTRPNATRQEGFLSGVTVGLTLGLIWAPCVGPILASVITLAFTGTVTGTAILITLAYSIGTAIPMLAITYFGRNLLTRTPWLVSHTAGIQKIFGVLMIVTAIAIYFNVDRKLQVYILKKFPNYGTGLTRIEENPAVKQALLKLSGKPVDTSQQGKPMFDVVGQNIQKAPELIGGQQWFNSEPLTLEQLKGKVVLVDFWTYTCINCIRTFPYTKAWYEKYKDRGFVLIGVHTPEFEFEKNPDNVAKAIKDFGITYPVVQDNDYAIWKAYANNYWPAHYLIDKNGTIRDTHFGEGAYDETEEKIVTLLKETGAAVDASNISNPTYDVRTNTPETYIGYERMQGFASPEQIKVGSSQIYTAPASVPYNRFALTGVWTVGREYAMPSSGASLLYHFDAANVYLVMRPHVADKSGKVTVLLDGKPISSIDAGDDVVNGTILVDTDRLYKIVKLSTPGEHTLQLKFQDGNLELYAFTFG